MLTTVAVGLWLCVTGCVDDLALADKRSQGPQDQPKMHALALCRVAKNGKIKNIENNPMYSSHVIAGISIFGYPENDLTRRANQGHIFSIPPSDPSQADQVSVLAIGTGSPYRFPDCLPLHVQEVSGDAKAGEIEDFSDEAFETIA